MPDPSSPRPIDAVLFDFHGTLAMTEPAQRCLALAAAACGASPSPARLAELTTAMRRAGLAEGWPPTRPPVGAVEAWHNRDLSADDHRASFLAVADAIDSGIDGLSPAMYERLLAPDGWVVYRDTVPTLRALRRRGVPVALVSNIGFDVRPIGKAHGFAEYVDEWVLSYQVGVCKPDPEIFRHACAALGVPPERALMVGDTGSDAGAVTAGCATLLLPASSPGATHGLTATLGMLGGAIGRAG